MFTLSNYKDVDDSVGWLINRYYELRDAGKYTEAYALLEENSTILKPYIINADSMNKIELGIYNLAQELYYSQRIILSPTEPNPAEHEMYIGSEWLQEY